MSQYVDQSTTLIITNSSSIWMDAGEFPITNIVSMNRVGEISITFRYGPNQLLIDNILLFAQIMIQMDDV